MISPEKKPRDKVILILTSINIDQILPASNGNINCNEGIVFLTFF